MGVSTAKRAASDQQELTALQAAYQNPSDPRYNDPATAQSIKDIQGTIPFLQNKASQGSPGIGGFLKTYGAPAAALALSAFAPGLGTALGGALLGAGATGASTLGSALIGGGLGALSGGIGGGGVSGALKGGALGAAGGGIGANIGDITSGVSSSLGDAASGVNNFATNNIPGLSSLESGVSSLGNSIGSGASSLGSSVGNALGLSGGAGTGGGSSFDLGGGAGASGSSLGDININPGPITASASNPLFNSPTAPLASSSVGTGTVGGGLFGGGSSFNLGGALASALGGINQNSAIKKAQGQLTNSDNQQIANLQSFNPSGITSDPGYQFNLDQGNLGLQRQLAATGGLQSGAALKAASQYNQNYASNAFNNYYQRWANQTGAKNQLLANQGQVGAQGTVGQANNLSSALSGVLNPTSGVSAQSLLSLLGKQQNPNPFA